MSHALEDSGETDTVELLIQDKGWVGVQIKAFTAWLNQTLQNRSGMKFVENIAKDLQDGVVLINFFELLAGKKMRDRWETKPKHRIQLIQNVHLALLFMEKEMDVRNPGIGAEEIVDTNVKLVLGLLWTLYRKYRIAVIQHEGKGSEEGLLSWVKEVTQDYKGVEVNGWKDSFQDGLAFLAMVHAFGPDTTGVKYDSYSKQNKVQNLEAAFDYAEKELSIPKLLDAAETAEGVVDERSLILYTSLYFHAFRAKEEREALDAERRKREAALEEEQRNKLRLEEDNKLLWERIEELHAQIKAATDERDNLKKRGKKFSKQIEYLKQKDEELAAEKKRLKEEIEEYLKRIQELKDRLEKELSGMSDTEKQMASKLQETAARVHELEELQAQLEMDIGNYKSQIADLKAELENEIADREAKDKIAAANKERERVQISGLEVLKINLDQHIDDVHRFKSYIEYDKKAEIDYNVKQVDVSGLSKLDFQAQLESLSSSLIKENMEMLRVLQEREVEYQKKEEERLKKEAKKKKKSAEKRTEK